jgi:pimeloyl-ACP methyl ester carboxylesterase
MPTRHGPSHVLIAGPPQATPIVCLHAMRTGSAHLLSELPDLVRRFRLIAPDLPDQSVRGLQLRLPMAGHAQADWLQDILDGFGLDQVNLFGVSWGGFVARQTASAFPTRIRRLALLVPAGIANGSHWKGLTKMAWPLLRYRLRRTDQNLRRLLEPLITTWDVDWSAYMADTLRYLRTDLRIPPLATDDELRRLTMPVLALGAEHDLSFPGEAVVRRIRAIAPKAEGEVIPDCKHCPPTTPEFRKWLADRLTSFFSGPA